jgi:hypothetical protein
MIDDSARPDPSTLLPIIRTLADADRHDWERPGLAWLDGRWLRPVLYLQENLERATPEGSMVRALEALLLGLIDRESSLIEMGLVQALAAAAVLTRSPESVLEQVVAEERARAAPRPVRPKLQLLRGERDDPRPR